MPSPATSASRRRTCRNTGAIAPRPKRIAWPCRTACRSGSATVEAPDPIMDLVTFYSQNLAVPARRDIDKPDVLSGKQLFYESGCASCHTPKFVTRRDAPEQGAVVPADLAVFRFPAARHGRRAGRRAAGRRRHRQRMAHAAAVGHRADQDASTATPSSCMTGARAISTEAILWHGGEAAKARDAFAALGKAGPRRAGEIPGVAVMRERCCSALIVRWLCRRLASAGQRAKTPMIVSGAIDGFVRPAYAGFHAALEPASRRDGRALRGTSRPTGSTRRAKHVR